MKFVTRIKNKMKHNFRIIISYVSLSMSYGFYRGYTHDSRLKIKENLYTRNIANGLSASIVAPFLLPCSIFSILERFERKLRNLPQKEDAELF